MAAPETPHWSAVDATPEGLFVVKPDVDEPVKENTGVGMGVVVAVDELVKDRVDVAVLEGWVGETSCCVQAQKEVNALNRTIIRRIIPRSLNKRG